MISDETRREQIGAPTATGWRLTPRAAPGNGPGDDAEQLLVLRPDDSVAAWIDLPRRSDPSQVEDVWHRIAIFLGQEELRREVRSIPVHLVGGEPGVIDPGKAFGRRAGKDATLWLHGRTYLMTHVSGVRAVVRRDGIEIAEVTRKWGFADDRKREPRVPLDQLDEIA